MMLFLALFLGFYFGFFFVIFFERIEIFLLGRKDMNVLKIWKYKASESRKQTE